MSDGQSAATRAVRAALESDTQHGAVVPPIHLTSTYAFSSFGEKGAYDYTRSGNPTRDALGASQSRGTAFGRTSRISAASVSRNTRSSPTRRYSSSGGSDGNTASSDGGIVDTGEASGNRA